MRRLVWTLVGVLRWWGTWGKLPEFVPDNSTQTCSGDVHSTPWNEKIFGVNIGGWMVLEPWITPSLFYQFLGGHSFDTAMDTYSFCQVLGPKKANAQLRRHWKTWVTKGHLELLAGLGINSLRLPIGDFMYAPYGPYRGCVDGSLAAVDQLLDWANEFGLQVLLDVHAVRRSANGLDNGGLTKGVKWTSTLKDVASDAITFEHWPRREAGWMGHFDRHEGKYPELNWTHVEDTIDVIAEIARRYSTHPAVLGIEPVNEPWEFTPIHALKRYYWEAYLAVKAVAPHWRFVMHDSFRFSTDVWGGFMKGCPDIALDTHIYQAWFDPSTRDNFYANACAQKDVISNMEDAFGPVIVGEWSLATDNCAMWLNGFNDNLPGYPKLPCKLVPCAAPYMGVDVQPGAPPSVLKPLQGPFGTGVSGPLYGLCPVDRDWGPTSPAQIVGGAQRTAADLAPEPPSPELDETDEVMANLAMKKLQAFGLVAHGFFFWNFRTELEDQWSYLRAVERGWIPPHTAKFADAVAEACTQEDVHCKSLPNATDDAIRAAALFAVGYDAPDKRAALDSADGLELRQLADRALDAYWILHRNDPPDSDPNATHLDPIKRACDFNGAAGLSWSPYRCLARRVEEEPTRDGMAYCVGYDPDLLARYDQLHGEALFDEADKVFQGYWASHRFDGATCDFGGAAILVKIKEQAPNADAAIDPDALAPGATPENVPELNARRDAQYEGAKSFTPSNSPHWSTLAPVVVLVFVLGLPYGVSRFGRRSRAPSVTVSTRRSRDVSFSAELAPLTLPVRAQLP